MPCIPLQLRKSHIMKNPTATMGYVQIANRLEIDITVCHQYPTTHALIGHNHCPPASCRRSPRSPVTGSHRRRWNALQADKGLIGQLDQVRQTVVDRTSDLVVTAIGFMGVPYRRGGNTVETGFDCSGFVRAMYNQTVGHLLPRRAEEQAAATQPVTRSRAQARRPGVLQHHAPRLQPCRHLRRRRQVHPRTAHRRRSAGGRHERQLLAAPLQRRTPCVGGARPGQALRRLIGLVSRQRLARTAGIARKTQKIPP